ncbi:hypothetical protein KC711_01255 [Candidatus Peregrinibacteria bacterium]|nr:hypothetical protein [Candidatus Peregrinibacteria bacterium]MCB9804270.1 hypothetical protein [Candidatus Peribacteria bacterium]
MTIRKSCTVFPSAQLPTDVAVADRPEPISHIREPHAAAITIPVQLLLHEPAIPFRDPSSHVSVHQIVPSQHT